MLIPVVLNECLNYIVIVLIVDFAGLLISYFFRVPVFGLVVSAISLFLFLAILYFFRDPKRNVVCDENSVLSPADGKVVAISKDHDKEYLNAIVNRISIFLSVFDVHIQRASISGKVELIKHIDGKFLCAWNDLASVENEQNHIGILYKTEKGSGKILIKQIAGILARRTVAWVKENDNVKTGDKIGIIKFGSRVDILLPENTEIKVKKGDKVKAGETLIGVL